MLRIVKLVLSIVLMALIITFIVQNNDQTVSIKFLKLSSPNLSLWIYCLVSLFIGLAIGFLFSIVGTIQQKARIHSLEKKNRNLTSELNGLRNAELDEELESIAPAADENTGNTETTKES